MKKNSRQIKSASFTHPYFLAFFLFVLLAGVITGCKKNSLSEGGVTSGNKQMKTIISNIVGSALERNSETPAAINAKKQLLFKELSKVYTKQDSIKLINALIAPQQNISNKNKLKGNTLFLTNDYFSEMSITIEPTTGSNIVDWSYDGPDALWVTYMWIPIQHYWDWWKLEARYRVRYVGACPSEAIQVGQLITPAAFDGLITWEPQPGGCYTDFVISPAACVSDKVWGRLKFIYILGHTTVDRETLYECCIQ